MGSENLLNERPVVTARFEQRMAALSASSAKVHDRIAREERDRACPYSGQSHQLGADYPSSPNIDPNIRHGLGRIATNGRGRGITKYFDNPVCYGRMRIRANKALAERVGFEPTVRLPVHCISSAAHSTSLPPLRRSNRCPAKGARPVEEPGG